MVYMFNSYLFIYLFKRVYFVTDLLKNHEGVLNALATAINSVLNNLTVSAMVSPQRLRLFFILLLVCNWLLFYYGLFLRVLVESTNDRSVAVEAVH